MLLRHGLIGGLAVVALMVGLGVQVQAATIFRFDFTVTGFGLIAGSAPATAPVDPVVGSVTIAFDPSVSTPLVAQTTGITLDSLNILSDYQIGYLYTAGPIPSNNILIIGGLWSGLCNCLADTVGGGISVASGTNNFFMIIQNIALPARPGVPLPILVTEFVYSQVDTPFSLFLFCPFGQGGGCPTPPSPGTSATMTQLVPEPTTLALLTTGLIGVVLIRWPSSRPM